ncbi:uncharacterized protein LOC115954488 [Quercus lobata]|uniref:uncharacterized protein LOC115954488 n=1 Tax=Quercus lobata TaxID=97700 RepID=UPI00124824E4|nr:uncharacterized protein LOC115954488 [Quercus lobata]
MCAFGVTAGKFLGFMVSQRGIEVSPEKIRAIVELNGKIAALNRFVSRATNKCLPFFYTLKRSFEWTDECQQAFENLKLYLSSPPLLSPSKLGEELSLYLAISQATVSTALVREEDGFTLQAEHFEEQKKEYEALIVGLDLAKAAGAKNMIVHYDSQVVTNQVNGSYECKNERMNKYLEEITARTPTEETSFRIAYKSEAIIPIEVGFTSYRVENYDENKNDEAIRLQLDLVDKVRAIAEQRLVQYQNLMAKHYNSKVRHRDF